MPMLITTTRDRIKLGAPLASEQGGLIPHRQASGGAYFVVTSAQGLTALGYALGMNYPAFPFAHLIDSESFAEQREEHLALHASLIDANPAPSPGPN